MVDFIKIIIKDQLHSVLEANPLLDFYDNINLSTGELKTVNRYGNKITPFKNAFYNGLEFIIYDTGTVTLSGSLHKYWNNGAHNFNDFNFEAFLWVLKDMENKFKIQLENCILKCLEIGINIIPPIQTNEILNYCFLHKTLPFEYKHNSDEGKYKQAQHAQYIIKIYNKALHYKSKGFQIKTEIMRFEIKYTKMEKLNNLGIYNLNDLKTHGLHNFKNELLKEFSNILFYDNSICSQSKSLNNYKNPLYWTELLSNNQKDLFNYHRKQLKNLTARFSDKVQFQTSEILSKKIDLLNIKTTQIDPLTILSNRVACQVTKIDISMQKDNSVLLSHTGLKHYYKNDPKIFEQIKRRYLSKRWLSSDFETQIKEIAHNIRNTKSNQMIKQERIYPPQQINMFSDLGF
ncbi:hypothetical protein [Flavobacterium nitratireducens]|uniref:hypothetical protein n=1 Tax=Flavobacterium nitratireducens TaxID=992289 RepID=UPI0024151479|nr:hypothetical protein [Flavobacterium nitratireducens]